MTKILGSSPPAVFSDGGVVVVMVMWLGGDICKGGVVVSGGVDGDGAEAG